MNPCALDFGHGFGGKLQRDFVDPKNRAKHNGTTQKSPEFRRRLLLVENDYTTKTAKNTTTMYEYNNNCVCLFAASSTSSPFGCIQLNTP